MPPSSVQFYLSILATFLSPLLPNPWLWAVTAAIASIVMSVALKFTLKTGLLSALCVGGLVFGFFPQQPSVPSESRANNGPATSTGVSGAPGSSTKDVLVDSSTFKDCDSGLENHGAMENIIIRNTSVDCPPRLGPPSAAPPAVSVPLADPKPGDPSVSPRPAPLADPSKASQLNEPSKRGTSGLYNSPGANTYDAAIVDFRSVGCDSPLTNIQPNSIMLNVQINCRQPTASAGAKQAQPPQSDHVLSTAQTTDQENKRRQEILDRLGQEFIATEGRCATLGDPSFAKRWANRRLLDMGESWQLPVGTVAQANINENYVYGGCNRIDVQAGNARVNGNHLFSEDNNINVGAGKAEVDGNEMRALPMLPQEKSEAGVGCDRSLRSSGFARG